MSYRHQKQEGQMDWKAQEDPILFLVKEPLLKKVHLDGIGTETLPEKGFQAQNQLEMTVWKDQEPLDPSRVKELVHIPMPQFGIGLATRLGTLSLDLNQLDSQNLLNMQVRRPLIHLK